MTMFLAALVKAAYKAEEIANNSAVNMLARIGKRYFLVSVSVTYAQAVDVSPFDPSV